MKATTLFLLAAISLFAVDRDHVITLFTQKEYARACAEAWPLVDRYVRDEEFMTLYGFSCLYADQIDQLSMPISKLKFSPQARANASYFATILMQKKLLIHAMADGYDIRGLKFPTTDFILSKVFDLYQATDPAAPKSVYTFTDPDDPAKQYKLSHFKDGVTHKITIEEYYDRILSQRHTYW